MNREEGPIDRAVRAEKHTVGHNSVVTFAVPRESVLENRENAQPEYPRRGILALQSGEDVNGYSDGFKAEFTDKPHSQHAEGV
ncbi:hypothetical protein [Halalkalicoccus paucihalophilus]|uniref:hypothetical protein n=1 Tax=Halalkalicoccus paucihalophilus TaxID=1008153 RepID=UPI0012EDA24E|nr:hypothetical protein [Halalkalicoccus paucihalophilus]